MLIFREFFNTQSDQNILEAAIYNKLSIDINSNPNTNYDILAKALADSKEKHIPKTIKKFNKYKHKKIDEK